jgi:hypothetical protein
VFGLTSPVLLGLVAALVAVLLGGVLWGWPRLAGPGWRLVGVRVSALIVLNASVVALIFVAVNRSNDFYTSWADLFGRYQGGGTLLAVHPATASIQPAPPPPALILRTDPVRIGRSRTAGRLQTVMFHGQLSGLRFEGHVYVPPGYPVPGRRYPVLVTVSTSASSTASPYGAGHIAATIATEIAAHRLRPLIAVILPPGPGSDLGCLDVPAGPQATLFFAQDLPAALGSRYQVAAAPGGLALLADATGGYCALHLALTNAAVFGAVAVPPAAYQTPPGSPGWAGSPQLRQQDNLIWLLRHQPPPPITVLFTGPRMPGAFRSLAASPMRMTAVPVGPRASPLAHVLDRVGALLGGLTAAGG